MDREDRIKAAQQELEGDIKNTSTNSKGVIDFSKIGGFKKELIYKPTIGGTELNRIDVLPYLAGPNNVGGVLEGTPTYRLKIWVHRFVGPEKEQFLCLNRTLGRSCPICEDLEQRKSTGMITDKEYKNARAKERAWYNVLNKNKQGNIQLFEESTHLFQKKLALAAGRGGNLVTFQDIEIGKTVEFIATETHSPDGKYTEYGEFMFIDRQPYDERIYKFVHNLDDMLIIPTYEQVKNAYFGTTQQIPNSPDIPIINENFPEPENVQDLIGGNKTNITEISQQKIDTNNDNKCSCPYGHTIGKDRDDKIDCVRCPSETYEKCMKTGEGK